MTVPEGDDQEEEEEEEEQGQQSVSRWWWRGIWGEMQRLTDDGDVIDVQRADV